MIQFFKTPGGSVIATECKHTLTDDNLKALCWLFGEATVETNETLEGYFIGPRREMVTPWSTNAVEITQNMNINGLTRIEEYFPVSSEEADYDPMLQRMYRGLDQNVFKTERKPEPIRFVDNIEEENDKEGLALSPEEIEYLHGLERQNRFGSVRLCPNQLGALPPQDIRRLIHHRRQGNAFVTLCHD